MTTDGEPIPPDTYRDRQRWDRGHWPELADAFTALERLVFASPPGPAFNLMVFTVASQASGCRHCQAHGSYAMHHLGGYSIEKVRALWDWERSDLFDDRERAALRFAMAAGAVPNGVTPQHHEDLRRHFDDVEIRTLFGVVALSGYLNRFNDSLATVTDAASAEWAAAHLGDLGWSLGKHAGAASERRPDLPRPAER